MPTIAETDTFTQIVQFEVAPEKYVALIAAEVERWVRNPPGFVSSSLHASMDGRHVVNYAQWRTEADFHAFTQHPESTPLGGAVRAVGPASGPHAVACRAVRCITPPQGGNS